MSGRSVCSFASSLDKANGDNVSSLLDAASYRIPSGARGSSDLGLPSLVLCPQRSCLMLGESYVHPLLERLRGRWGPFGTLLRCRCSYGLRLIRAWNLTSGQDSKVWVPRFARSKVWFPE